MYNHTTAVFVVALHEAATPAFRAYAAQIIANAQALAAGLVERGFAVITGGTDNHLVLVDVTTKGIGGKPLARALDAAGIVCNYNSVPFDPRKPFDPSGIRLGTPSVTSRGMGTGEMAQIAAWIERVAAAPTDEAVIAKVRGEVVELTRGFAAPGLAIE